MRFLGRKPRFSPYVGIRKASIGKGVVRVFLGSLFEVLAAHSGSFLSPLLHEVAALQVCFVSFRIDGPWGTWLHALIRRKFQTHFVPDRVRDLTLKLQNTLYLTVVLCCPEMALVTYLNQ